MSIQSHKVKKGRLLVPALIVFALAYVSCSDSAGWSDYLGNPQRTGYSSCRGPDMPEILWKVSTQGVFDTSPFIVDDKVIILWKDSQFNTFDEKVMVIDLLTGEVLQDLRSPLFSEVFPVDDRIFGLDGRNISKIDLVSEEITLLAKIPEKSSRNPKNYPAALEWEGARIFNYISNNYPVVLEDTFVIPTIPTVCLSKSDLDLIWNLDTTGNDLTVYNVAGDEDIVVFLLSNGIPKLLAVDPSTGMTEWMSDQLPAAFWLTLGEDIYCGGENLWAFGRDGSELWTFATEEMIVSNIALGPDAIYISDAANNVYRIDFNGNLMWKTECEGSPFFQKYLIGAGDILFCVETFGENPAEPAWSQVTAYEMGKGSKMWSLSLEGSGWLRASPALTEDILVIGTMNGEAIAIASDPDLYVRQGDTFLSEGSKEKALTSYKKAQELYEKKGSSKAQEIQKKIQELEKSPPFKPAQSGLPPESSLLQFKSLILLSAVAVVILAGILVTYYLFVTKTRNK